jgi:nickel-type superoxide dismutase maturation protease
LYRIEGESMLPALRPGQLVLGCRWIHPRSGQVVVARRNVRVIKRVTKIMSDGLWLEGDNAAVSTDSRHFGAVPGDQIEAVILGH